METKKTNTLKRYFKLLKDRPSALAPTPIPVQIRLYGLCVVAHGVVVVVYVHIYLHKTNFDQITYMFKYSL